MAAIIPPHSSSPSVEAHAGLQQTAKSASKAVEMQTGVVAPGQGSQAGSAELAISETARLQIRSLAAAERNANDVIAMAQTADGALDQMGGLLERMRALALEDAGEQLGDRSRADAQLAFSQLQSQVDAIQKSAVYDGRTLLGSEEVEVEFDVAFEGHLGERLAATLGGLGPLTVLASAPATGGARRTSDAVLGRIDHALAAITEQRARFGATVTRFADTAAAVQTARASRAAAGPSLGDAAAAEDLAKQCKSVIFGLGQAALLTQANQLPSHAMTLLQD